MQKHYIQLLRSLGTVLATITRRVLAVLVLCAVLSGAALADSQSYNIVIQSDSNQTDLNQTDLNQSAPASVRNVLASNFKRTDQMRAFKTAISERKDLMLPNSFAQRVQANQQKSRRQVIDEVERSYNAKVLKVSLDQGAGVYVVRILQSDGRVRTIRVSAYR
ncbi:MAG: hypothetical protein P8I38_10555 [Arenicella sp.]|jgi:uncharacterized membrane protein YkoI|nr:hypothetical protein [Arenicella sp.]